MGAVVQAIVQPVVEVAKAAETVVKPIVQAVEQVGKAVEQTAQAVAKDPLPVLVSIAAAPVLGPAAAAIGLPSAAVAPLTAAAISAAQGNSIEDIAKSAAASFVGGQVASQVSAALPTDIAQVVKDVVPSAATGATVAGITGQDPLTAALASGVAGGVAGQVTPELGKTAGTVAGQTAGAVAAGRDLEQALGTSLAGAALSELGKAARETVSDITRPAPTEVAQAQPETMEDVLAQMFAEEQAKPIEPQQFAQLAAGGVASDVAPTPLVPTGTVTVTSPTETLVEPRLAGTQLTPEEEIQLEQELATETARQEAAITPPAAAPTPTPQLPIAEIDRQIFDLLQRQVAQQAPAPQAPAPQVPQIVPTPELPRVEEQVAEVTPETFIPEEPAPVTQAPMPTPPISAGPVEQPQAPTAPPMAGMTEEERRTREILDLIGVPAGEGPRESMGMGTTEMAGTLPGIGAGVEEPVTGESMGMEADEGELVDTGPREPLATEQVAGITPMVVMGGAPTARGTRRTGFAPSDSTLGALLGTALTPSGATEPILGEDESRRRAVWNIESLRNALGI